MFSNVIVRVPGKSLTEGISGADEGKPNYTKAIVQHENYINALTKTGVGVNVLPPMEDFPDSCFIEDNALCTSKCAIISRPGAQTRREEVQAKDLRPTLSKFYDNIEEITAPGTIEPGDIMMVGDHFYIGLSARTNAEGAHQMISILEKYGLSGETVEMKEMLHLKTGVNYLEHNNLLVAGEFKNDPRFDKFNKIEIPEDEAYAANCIWINDYVIVPAGYPKVKKAIEELGQYKVLEVDTSEYRKVDGGLSCLSLRF
ncbi:N(G),N(G)-dimethylarginine dimethylaminohydrolase [Ligilactobacillus pobuzihii]|uniref:dimethylarginine dimethylaminohydrolase family protein n=1 Tax=Ligilactobacillus pobuzihii TaxID=449659 RepID=UPI0019CF5292|nr:arginine deiminase family protein [Ligilactobacillus pobuzihii]MBN7274750.1 N(G),N(G)-dimethylarginine dimethylaminohydrolase [Ligilactobacillus pobuzihii]